MAIRYGRGDVKQTTTGFRDPRHHICHKQIPIPKKEGGSMAKRLVLVLSVCLTVLLISSCGGGGTSSGAVSVNGSWSGSWTSSTGDNGALSATFTSTGSTFSGPVTIYNSYYANYVMTCKKRDILFATGTVSGSSVTIGVSSNAIIFVGTVSSSSISGLYEVYSGACSGDSGKFSLSK